MHSTILVLLLVLGATVAYSLPSGKRTGCQYISSLKGYDCAGIDLFSVPQDLYSSTQILDVSFNRIREINRATFQNYPNLKKLYLNVNMIQIIADDTFEDLTDLDTLDLTLNSLREIPSSILHLPSLRNLMIANNLELNILSFFNNAGTITAPLQYLDLSFNPLLNQLPNFGVMMDLVHLNMTGNHVTNVSKAHFVGMCNLKIFTNVNLTMEFATACDCAQIDKWFSVIKVKSYPEFTKRCEFASDTLVAECNAEDIEPNAAELAAHEKCVSEFQVRETLRSAAQICLIVFGTIGGILLFIGICYVYYRFQRFSDDDENKNKTDLKTKVPFLHDEKGRAI